jgi:hypothetical protein
MVSAGSLARSGTILVRVALLVANNRFSGYRISPKRCFNIVVLNSFEMVKKKAFRAFPFK